MSALGQKRTFCAQKPCQLYPRKRTFRSAYLGYAIMGGPMGTSLPLVRDRIVKANGIAARLIDTLRA